MKRIAAVALATCLLFVEGNPGWAQEKTVSPATVEQARAVLDLSQIPLFPGTDELPYRALAQLSYEAAAEVTKAFEFHQQEVLKQGWKELPGTYSSETSCSGTFEKAGFKLSLSVSMLGQANKSLVMLMQHGNAPLDQLPLPPDTKSFYSGPANAIFLAEKSVDETVAAFQELYLKQGWKLYGEVPGSLYLRKNAVLVKAYISAAPAQMGKTMIQLSSELVSVELPAPDKNSKLQYSDSPTQLYFESPLSEEEVFAFYRNELAPSGWSATTDRPLEVSIHKELIFRNPAKDMLTLMVDDVEGKRTIRIKYSRAVEVAREEERARAALAAKASKPEGKPTPAKEKVVISLPADARNVASKKDEIKFSVPAGKARMVVAAWRKEFVDAGWKEVAAVLEAPAGNLTLSKGEGTLTITYLDPGVIPTEITIDAFGFELEAAKAGAKK